MAKKLRTRLMYGPFLHIKNINSTIPCSPYRIKIFKGESFKGALSSPQFTALFTPSISVSNLPCRFTKGMIFLPFDREVLMANKSEEEFVPRNL